jgi:hypothetical protein
MTASASAPGGNAGRSVVGGFFLMMAGVHLGIVASDPETYRDFAQGGLFAFVRDGWTEIVMARPEVYGLLLMTGEAVLGAALLIGGRAARLAWVGVIGFHLLLILFGWWFLVWVVPALALVVPLARRDLALGTR